MLRPDQSARYARHLLLDGFGALGQERVLSATVTVIGDGRGAEEATLYLAAAGVGRLIVSEPVFARLGERVRDMNPDVALATAAGPRNLLGGSAVVDVPGDSRREGAAAALAALVALANAEAPYTWQTTPEEPWRA
ncbi:MAG: hypothetical protein KC635_04075 [Myxococcales bacterium]|nr:hypothetical protein [Myxococcales bacterium]